MINNLSTKINLSVLNSNVSNNLAATMLEIVCQLQCEQLFVGSSIVPMLAII